MDYQELIKLFTKGDQQALKDLLVYAKSLNEENKLLERWIEKSSLSPNLLPRIVEGMNKRFIFTTVDYDIYHESDVGGQLWPLTSLLNSALDEIDGVNSIEGSKEHYAGATTPSRLAYVMEGYFGMSPSSSPVPEIQAYFNERVTQSLEYLRALPLEVRILIELLADEVERRLHTFKKC
jgi:hypothetical protein